VTTSFTFNANTLPIVAGVAAGTKVEIRCSGLAGLHQHLLLQVSLLIGIDPKAAALLSGGSLRVGTFESALAARPEVDTADLSGIGLEIGAPRPLTV